MGALIRTAALGQALFLANDPASAQLREPVWPMRSGSHEVLHSFQNPFNFSQYFHEGVDLRWSPQSDVLAMRSGIVRFVNQGAAGGTLRVEVQTPSGFESDSYLHVRIDPWLPGDEIHAGERVGQVSTVYFPFPLQDHVHVNRFRGRVTGNGYVTGRTNMLHPLALFSAEADRDPQEEQPRPSDADEDGSVFWIAPIGNPNVHLPFASGAVELLVEATDRQNDTLYFGQGLLGIGYWIESLVRGGEDVASAEKPYRLLRFDDEWRSSHPNCDGLVSTALLAQFTHEVEFGPDSTGWNMLATYRITRAAGFRGRGDEISASQSWHTKVRRGTGALNGTGGIPASTPAEARFPDGPYRVHVLTEDLVRVVDTPFELLVDNFHPIVASLRVVDAVREHELGHSTWEFDADTGALEPSSTVGRPLRPGDRVRFELELSEPMSELETVALEPALGPLTAWTSTQEPAGRTRFQAELRVVSIPPGARLVRLVLDGRDLCGRVLVDPAQPGEPRAASDIRAAVRTRSGACALRVPVSLEPRSGRAPVR